MKTHTQIINDILIHGKRKSYELIVNEFSEYIFAFVKSIVGNGLDAQDITQEVFIKGYFNLKKLKDVNKLKSWISQIAYNESISHLRKKKRGMDISFIENIKYDSEAFLDDREEEIELKISTERDLELLNEALKRIKDEELFLIKAFYFEKKSIKAIEEITGLSESNIKIRLHRIKKRLKEIINRK